MDISHFEMNPGENYSVCAKACMENPECRAYTYVKAGIQGNNPVCWLKNSVPDPKKDSCCTSGLKSQEMQYSGAFFTTPVLPLPTKEPDAPSNVYSANTSMISAIGTLPTKEPVTPSPTLKINNSYISPGVFGQITPVIPVSTPELKEEGELTEPVPIRTPSQVELSQMGLTLDEWTKIAQWSPEKAKTEFIEQVKILNLPDKINSLQMKVKTLDFNSIQKQWDNSQNQLDYAFLDKNNLQTSLSGASAKDYIINTPNANPSITKISSISDPKNQSSFVECQSGSCDDPSNPDWILTGNYALIEGNDFGYCFDYEGKKETPSTKCSVTLKWSNDLEFGSYSDNSIELKPATGSWDSSWKNQGIGVYVPYNIPNLRDYTKGIIEIKKEVESCQYGLAGPSSMRRRHCDILHSWGTSKWPELKKSDSWEWKHHQHHQYHDYHGQQQLYGATTRS